MKKVKTAFIVILFVAVLALAVGFIVTFFNPKTKQVSRFVLRYENRIVTDMTNVVFPAETVKVQARHVFEFAESDTTFTVKVVPNADAEFTFRVGSVPYKFTDVEDLTPAFDIAIEKDGFTIDVSDATPQSVLDKLFVGTVTLPDDLESDFYFALVVTSANGEAATINFRVRRQSVTDIELTPSEGVFF